MITNNLKAQRFLQRAKIYIRSNEEMSVKQRETAPLKSDAQIKKIMSDWSLFVSTFNILDEELGYHNLTKEELKKEFLSK